MSDDSHDDSRFTALIEHAPFSVQILDLSGRIVRVNRAWETLWGLTLDQVADYRAFDDVELEAKGAMPFLRRAYAGETVHVPPLEYDPNRTLPNRSRHRDPRRWLSTVMYPLKDNGGGVSGVVIVHEDMTAEYQAQRELVRSEERFARAFRASPDPLALSRLSDGMMMEVNDSFLELVGLTREAVIGRRSVDLGFLQDPTIRDRLVDSIRQAGRVRGQELELRHSSGAVRWVIFSAEIIEFDGEKWLLTISRDVTQEKQARDALLLSEKRFRSLSETGMIGIISGTGAVIESANDEFLRMVGYTRAELEAGRLRWQEMTPPEFAPLDEDSQRQMRVRGWCDPFEKEYLHRDGRRVPILLGAALLNLEPFTWICFVLDLSARRGAEKALRESEARFRTLADGAPVAIGMARQGVTLYINRAYRRFFNVQEDREVLGHSLLDQVAPEDHERIKDYVRRRYAGEPVPSYYEFKGRRRDGSTFPAAAEVAQIALPDGPATIAFIIDQTERVRADEANAKLAAIVEFSEDAIIGEDLDGTVSSWNAGAEHLFGYAAEEMLDRSAVLLAPPEREHEERWLRDEVKSGRATNNFRTVRRTKNGELVDVALTVSPVRDDRGTVAGVSKIARDITELKKAEEKLERTVAERTAELRESNEQLEAFVYSVAHDLRAPLRAMTGFAQLLREEHSERLDESAVYMLKRIQASSEFMDRLVLDLLAYGRTARASIELTPIVIERAWETARFQCASMIEKSDAQVHVEHPLGEAMGHEAMLGQCLANLLGNAVKFVPSGVTPQVKVYSERRHNRVRIWVCDNGIGIPEEFHERIFRVFERVHVGTFDGSGIGLTIVRKGVERMGGKVGVESTAGHGSRFWIELGVPERPIGVPELA